MLCRAIAICFVLLTFCTNVSVSVAQVCADGTLLFREDFGGNSPEDLPISVNPSPGMSPNYQQITLPDVHFSSGRYMLTKNGGKNGNQWYWQDDHTYSDDYERGYLLLVDGSGGEHQFFEVVMDGLCSGVPMYFSAWVVNVHTVEHERVWGLDRIIRPNLTFAIYDGETGTLLDSYDTGPIYPDASLPLSADYKKSSQWNQYGIRFSLPEGSHAARMRIVNHASYGVGNDFAMDDIEVRLCNEKPEIVPPAKICEGGNVRLTVRTGGVPLPDGVVYRWLFSPTGEIRPGAEWRTLADTDEPFYTVGRFSDSDNGFYRVAVANAENIDREYCRSMSDPLRLLGEVCPCSDIADTVLLADCDSAFYEGNIYRADGVFALDTVVLSTGCDSLSFLRVELRHSVSRMLNVSLCEGEDYDFDGERMAEKGIYSRLYQASNLCDSVVVLHLDVQRCEKDEEENPFIPCDDKTGEVLPDMYFTPNADGVNDRWEIKNLGCYRYEVYIFDRFGKELRSWRDDFDGWDGTYLGKPMPSTDYWYYIRLLPHGEILTGHFTLVR